MLGKDIENIVKGIEKVRFVTTQCIELLASLTAEGQIASTDVMTPVEVANNEMEEMYTNMDTLKSKMFTDIATFNNSIGSPWLEYEQLDKAVEAGIKYMEKYGPVLETLQEKTGMLSILNMIMTAAVDAKWAFIYYHDYVQRGFDNVFNGNVPSVTFTNGLGGAQTTGNIEQDFSENVHIPGESIDPY